MVTEGKGSPTDRRGEEMSRFRKKSYLTKVRRKTTVMSWAPKEYLLPKSCKEKVKKNPVMIFCSFQFFLTAQHVVKICGGLMLSTQSFLLYSLPVAILRTLSSYLLPWDLVIETPCLHPPPFEHKLESQLTAHLSMSGSQQVQLGLQSTTNSLWFCKPPFAILYITFWNLLAAICTFPKTSSWLSF